MSDDLETEIAEAMGEDTLDTETAPDETETPLEPEVDPNLEPDPDSDPSSEAEIERIGKEQDRVRKYVARNMDMILGEEAANYTECILCNYWNTPGWMRIEECPPELVPMIHMYMGAHAPDAYKADTASRECDGCNGLGVVLTGSKVLGQDKLSCTVCGGSGWIAVGPERQGRGMIAPNGQAAAYPAPADSSQPAIEASQHEDPDAAALRQRGYIVIDPIAT